MKVIGFEEHYTLPAIAEANPNSPRKIFDVSRSGGGWPPPGIEDLGEGRIAAMDAAGIDVQILSNVPGVEAIGIPEAVELATQANDAVVAAAAEHPDRFLGLPPCRCATRKLPQPNWNAPCATMASSAR